MTGPGDIIMSGSFDAVQWVDQTQLWVDGKWAS